MDYLRGHRIKQLNSVWVYSDTKEPTAHNERDCGFCGLSNTKEGQDGCLGTLPGLMNACCGHGQDNEAYIQFTDGNTKHGMKAIETIKQLLNING